MTLMELQAKNRATMAMSEKVARMVFLCCLPILVATLRNFWSLHQTRELRKHKEIKGAAARSTKVDACW